MRVTSFSTSMALQQALREAQRRRADASIDIGTGRRITRFSDAPTDGATILRIGAQQADWESYARAADDAVAWLNTQDTALQTAVNALQRVRELTVSASNGSLNAVEREGIAREIESLRDQLVGLANTSYLGRAVFAGFADQAVGQVGGVWTYTGDGGAVNRQISPDAVVQVNIDASQAFGFASGTDVFTLLDRVAANVRAADTAATGGADLDDIAARTLDLTAALGGIGARTNEVDAAKSFGGVQVDNLRQNRSVLEDTDIAHAALELARAETSYEATLAATARVLSVSLVDFLR